MSSRNFSTLSVFTAIFLVIVSRAVAQDRTQLRVPSSGALLFKDSNCGNFVQDTSLDCPPGALCATVEATSGFYTTKEPFMNITNSGSMCSGANLPDPTMGNGVLSSSYCPACTGPDCNCRCKLAQEWGPECPCSCSSPDYINMCDHENAIGDRCGSGVAFGSILMAPEVNLQFLSYWPLVSTCGVHTPMGDSSNQFYFANSKGVDPGVLTCVTVNPQNNLPMTNKVFVLMEGSMLPQSSTPTTGGDGGSGEWGQSEVPSTPDGGGSSPVGGELDLGGGVFITPAPSPSAAPSVSPSNSAAPSPSKSVTPSPAPPPPPSPPPVVIDPSATPNTPSSPSSSTSSSNVALIAGISGATAGVTLLVGGWVLLSYSRRRVCCAACGGDLEAQVKDDLSRKEGSDGDLTKPINVVISGTQTPSTQAHTPKNMSAIPTPKASHEIRATVSETRPHSHSPTPGGVVANNPAFTPYRVGVSEGPPDTYAPPKGSLEVASSSPERSQQNNLNSTMRPVDNKQDRPVTPVA